MLQVPEWPGGQANEVLHYHGTTTARTQHIMRQGFDERLCSRGLYGRGVYFTRESCKALQYCDEGRDRCLILARVLLGDLFWAKGPMRTHKRPPEVDGHGLPHDSIIVRRGIPHGKSKSKSGGKQTH